MSKSCMKVVVLLTIDTKMLFPTLMNMV